MRKYPIHVTWAQGKIANTLWITWGQTFYDKQFVTVTTQTNFQNYYNEKFTYNVIIHWNLLYALKIWNYLNFIQKRSLIFLLNQVAKRWNIRKGSVKIEDWGTSVYFVLRFQENSMQSLSAI